MIIGRRTSFFIVLRRILLTCRFLVSLWLAAIALIIGTGHTLKHFWHEILHPGFVNLSEVALRVLLVWQSMPREAFILLTIGAIRALLDRSELSVNVQTGLGHQFLWVVVICILVSSLRLVLEEVNVVCPCHRRFAPTGPVRRHPFLMDLKVLVVPAPLALMVKT